MSGFFTRWLKVHQEEAGLFLGMAVLLFFINGSGIVLDNFVNTAFLKRYGVEFLPIMTAVNAVITFFLLGSMGQVIKSVRGDQLVFYAMLIAGVSIGALRLVVPLGIDLLYPVLYILKSQFAVLLAYLFWNLANDLFNTRQAKRLVPLITTGGIIGSLVGSFGTPMLAKLVSPDNLLLLFAAFSIAGAVSAQRLGAKWHGGTLKQQQGTDSEKHSMVKEFAKVIPLLKISTVAKVLLLLTLLPNIVIPIVNFQFNFVLDETFSTEEGLLSFLSYFRGAQFIIALLLSLFVGRIYGRFGLPISLMFHPFNYLIAFGAYLLQFNIFSAAYAGLSVGVIRTAINNPAVAALYGLLMPKDRAVLRPFLRGTVVRIGILAGSGFLWFGNMVMHPRYMSLVAAVFVLGWIGGTLLLKREYSKILLDLVRGELPDFSKLERGEVKNIFRGVDAGPVLIERFKSAEGEEAIWYAEVLRTTEQEKLDDVILERLPQVDDATKLRLLPLLSESAGEKVVDVFKAVIDPTKPELMVPLAQTMKRVFAQMPAATEAEIFHLARLPEVKVCFTGWMRRDEPEQYTQLIDRWINSDSLSERRAGVLAVGEGERREYADSVKKLLESEKDHGIVGIAIQTLSRIDPDHAVEMIVPFMKHSDEGVRLSVVESLVPDSELAVETLIMAMGDPDNRVRSQAIKRLTEISHELVPLLEAALGGHSRRIRNGLFEVSRALDIKDVESYRFCVGQLEIAYELLNRAEMLQSAPQGNARKLLLTHLDELRLQRVDNVMHHLAVRDRSGQFGPIHQAIESGDERNKGDSIEALDTLLDKRLSRILLPMLESDLRGEILAAGRRHLGKPEIFAKSEQAMLDELLQESDVISQILTLRVIEDWGKIEVYRSRIEQISTTGSGWASRLAGILLGKSEEVVMQDRLTLPERILQLRKVDLFQDLPVNELAAVALVATEVEAPADTVVLKGNDSCVGLYIIVNGEVSAEQVYANDNAVKQYATFEAGQSFGLIALFQEMSLDMTIRTTQDSLLLRIERDEFHAIIREYPEIALRVCQELCLRMNSQLERESSAHGSTESAS